MSSYSRTGEDFLKGGGIMVINENTARKPTNHSRFSSLTRHSLFDLLLSLRERKRGGEYADSIQFRVRDSPNLSFPGSDEEEGSNENGREFYTDGRDHWSR